MTAEELEPKRRRTSSVTRATEIMDLEEKRRRRQPDHPVHSPKDSLLSSGSGYTNYRGLLNLCLILMVLSNSRVALENLIKYGILINYSQIAYMCFGNTSVWPTIFSVVLLHIFVLLSYLIELGLSKHRLSSRRALHLAALNLTGILLCPVISVFSIQIHPVSASVSSLMYLIMFLKMFSYHHVNWWCRDDQKNATHRRHKSGEFQNGSPLADGFGPQSLVSYPDNLTLADIFYFCYAPTLCYELNFPRSQRRRKTFILKRLFEVIFLLQLNLALIQQWMVPTINNSLKPLQNMDIFRMLERLLKLAVPNHIIWLVMFYMFFHSLLNLIAEVLRFGDRQFYNDWWNSESVSYFWQNWNIPVHRWCVRHMYIPLLKQKRVPVNRLCASTMVFLLSAFFHEYLVSVPLKMFRLWAFGGMMAQIPLSFLVSEPYLSSHSANIAVWISLIIGQPLCILMYYHDYYVIHMAQAQTAGYLRVEGSSL